MEKKFKIGDKVFDKLHHCEAEVRAYSKYKKGYLIVEHIEDGYVSTNEEGEYRKLPKFEEDIQEMTVEDVEKLVGKKVKIIKSNA